MAAKIWICGLYTGKDTTKPATHPAAGRKLRPPRPTDGGNLRKSRRSDRKNKYYDRKS